MTTDKRPKREERGTFAQLYDVQEELSRRNSKPVGRPKKKVQRKPTTIHLTPSENRSLSKLQLIVNEKFSVNRSELAGVAIDILAALMEEKGIKSLERTQIQNLDQFRQMLYDFIDL